MRRHPGPPLPNMRTALPCLLPRGRFLQSHGFTLLELLFVVAMIATLAAISVPNFLEAQMRSKIDRTEQQFEILADALDAYRLDQGDLPPNVVSEEMYRSTLARIQKAEATETSGTQTQPSGLFYSRSYSGRSQESPFPSLLQANGISLIRLTTPVAYCARSVVTLDDAFSSRYYRSSESDVPTSDTQVVRDLATLRQWDRWEGILYWRLEPPASMPGEKSCALLVSSGPADGFDCRMTSVGLQVRPYDVTNGTSSGGVFYRFVPRQPAWFNLDYSSKPVPETQPGLDGEL